MSDYCDWGIEPELYAQRGEEIERLRTLVRELADALEDWAASDLGEIGLIVEGTKTGDLLVRARAALGDQ